MLNADHYWVRLRALRLAVKLNHKGIPAHRLIEDAKEIEEHLMGGPKPVVVPDGANTEPGGITYAN